MSRGHQIDFVAGGTAAFLRLRKVHEHPGFSLEIWNYDAAVVVNPGEPTSPTITGTVGREQLVDLVRVGLSALRYSEVLGLFDALEQERRQFSEDQITIKMFKKA